MNQHLEGEDTNSGTFCYCQWGEFVENLWTDKLAHLREGGEEGENEDEKEAGRVYSLSTPPIPMQILYPLILFLYMDSMKRRKRRKRKANLSLQMI